ncbi:MAG: FAD-dependent oxidoreductase [Candidatus Latescibacteria bacterium]|nr:FAD-dependent oxidoreductase [Candidatus Latescibacterota bacterium]
MKRRSFISSIPLLSGSVLYNTTNAETGVTGGNKPVVKGEVDFSGLPTIVEPEQKIPVIADTDVLVIGGGPAGVAAAVSASRAGSKTILVERYNHLGGLWTGGLVLPLLSTHAMDESGNFRKVIYGIGDEIAQKLFDMKMAIHEVNPVIDPEAAKYVLDVMIRESGVKMLYHCWTSNIVMSGNTIQAVIMDSKSGRVAIRPKVVIDCTGDGDIFHLAGEDYEVMNYHIGLVHRLGNVDRIDKTKPGYKEMELGGETPLPGVNWVNMHGEDDKNGIDLNTLSELQQKYRIAIWEKTEEIRSTPGYEQVYLLDTASQLGVRMSRILHGRYTLTLEDSMTFKAFDDVIGISGSWTMVSYKGETIYPQKRPLWQIPYRSLLPGKTKNLLVAGRCFSFEQALVEDTRIIGTCLVTGNGAGAAASVAVKAGSAVQDVDIKAVQRVLKIQGVNLG